METRSSGLPMFLGAYAVCVLFMACLIMIKYDATDLQNDTIVSLAPDQPVTALPPSRNLVVRNPIKKSVPAKRPLPFTGSNILVATLPTDDEPTIAERQAAAKKLWASISGFASSLSNVRITFEPEMTAATANNLVSHSAGVELAPNPLTLRAPNFGNAEPVDQESQTHRFSEYSGEYQLIGHRRVIELPSQNQDETDNAANGSSETAAPAELLRSRFAVFAHKRRILNELRWLKQTSVENGRLDEIRHEIEMAFEQAALDAGQCESGFYRVINDLYSLDLNEVNDEDQRLLDACRTRVVIEIEAWLILLEAGANPMIETAPVDVIDLQKLNIAIRRFLKNRLF